MKNKTMFSMLPNYADPGWYEEHAVIRFDTLYERREYEVMAVFTPMRLNPGVRTDSAIMNTRTCPSRACLRNMWRR